MGANIEPFNRVLVLYIDGRERFPPTQAFFHAQNKREKHVLSSSLSPFSHYHYPLFLSWNLDYLFTVKFRLLELFFPRLSFVREH